MTYRHVSGATVLRRQTPLLLPGHWATIPLAAVGCPHSGWPLSQAQPFLPCRDPQDPGTPVHLPVQTDSTYHVPSLTSYTSGQEVHQTSHVAGAILLHTHLSLFFLILCYYWLFNKNQVGNPHLLG